MDETKPIVERMLNLVAGVADYIKNHKESGLGTFKQTRGLVLDLHLFQEYFVTQEYKSRIGEFKKDFDGVVKDFDRAVELETLKTVEQIGTDVRQTKSDVEFLGKLSRSTFAFRIYINAMDASPRLRAEPGTERAL